MSSGTSRIVLIIGFLFVHVNVFAQSTSLPNNFVIEGRLYKSNGEPLDDTSTDVMFELVSASNSSCVLYREHHLGVNFSNSTDSSAVGVFALKFGDGTLQYPGVRPAFAKLFAPGPMTGDGGCNFTAAAGEQRYVRVSIRNSTTLGSWEAFPLTVITSAPSAMVAETAVSADTLKGYGTGSFVLTNASGLSQSNVESVFTTTNYTKLINLLNASGAGSFDFGTRVLQNVGTPASATDAVNKAYSDSYLGGNLIDDSSVSLVAGNGHTLVWDQNTGRWVAQALTLPASGVTAGTYGSSTTIPVVTVGTDGRITSAYGTSLSGISPGGAAGGDLAGTYPNPTIASDAITSAKLKSTGIAVNRLVATDATTGANLTYFTCNLNEIMVWTASGWACSTVSNLTALKTVAGKSPDGTGDIPLNAADITGLGNAATKSYGTGAGQLVELNGSGQLPPLDGSLLTNISATLLGGRAVGSDAPSVSEVLTWNGSQWEPSALPASVTSVTAGVGMVPTTITGTGQLDVDIGTTANKVIAFNATGQYPGADGSLIGNVNAVRLQARGVSATPPTGGQVLTFNGSTNEWEAYTLPAASSGTVTTVATGVGLVPTTITTGGTINIDVGTGANKIVQLDALGRIPLSAIETGVSANNIVQLDASARLPAVDGSQLTQLNAVSLQNTPVSAVAPTTGQVLSYNGSAWEAYTLPAASSGTVTTVATGVGLVPTTITTGGTINIDVGTGANKIVQLDGLGRIPLSAIETGVSANNIVQLDATARLPAVDGSQLTQLNAVSLQNTPVSAVAPTAGQVLSYNGSAWEAYTLPAASSGTVTTITAGTGLVPGTITTSGTLEIDVGTGANKIVQLDAFGRIPASAVPPNYLALDGSTQMTGSLIAANGAAATPSITFSGDNNTGVLNPAADTIGFSTGGTERMRLGPSGRLGIGTTSPAAALDVNITGTDSAIVVPRDNTANRPVLNATAGMIRYNTDLNKFEFYENGTWTTYSSGSGTISGVIAGTGLSGGAISGAATISVDVGSTTGKIVQVDTGNRLPVMDGSLLTEVNASRLQGQPVGTAAPSFNEVLTWNGSAWLPAAVNMGGPFLTLSGTSAMSGPVQLASGSAAAPSLTFAGDTDTGFYLYSSNSLAFSAAGAERFRLGSAGIVSMTSGSFILTNANSQAAPPYGFENDTDTGMYHPALDTLAFTTGGAEKLRLDIQGRVGIGTSTPTAALDVTATGTNSALVVPRDSTANRPALNVQNGMIRYNTDLNKFEFYENGAWTSYPTSAGSGTVTSVTAGTGLLGGTITTSGALSVDVGTGNGQIPSLTGGQLALNGGSMLAPAYTFNGDTDTGLYRAGTNALALSVGGDAALYMDALGQVGLGNTFPGARLDVSSILNSNSSTAMYGTYVSTSVSPSANISSGGERTGIYSNTSVSSSTTKQVVNAISGRAFNSGGGIVAQLSGVNANAQSTTGTVTALQGLIASSTVQGGIVTDLAGAIIQAQSSGGSTASMKGLSIYTNSSSGTVTNRYGIFLNNPSGAAPTGEDYGIYQAGPQRNYLGGALAIGQVNAGAALAVSATGTTSAILVPRDTTANRPAANAQSGMIRYNTDVNKFEFYEDGSWINYGTGSGGGVTFPLLATSPGSPTAPAYSFSSDSNSGLYNPSADTLALGVGGSGRLFVTPTGIGINTDSPDSTKAVDILTNYNGEAGIKLTNSNSGSSAEVGVAMHNGTSMGWVGLRGANMINLGGMQAGDAMLYGEAGVSVVTNGPSGTIRFIAGSDYEERMRITSNGVGIGTTSVGSAALAVHGTGANNSAILIPRNTTALRPAGMNGMIRYNTNTNRFEGFSNGGWGELMTTNNTLNNSGMINQNANINMLGNTINMGSGSVTEVGVISGRTGGALTINASNNYDLSLMTSGSGVVRVQGAPLYSMTSVITPWLYGSQNSGGTLTLDSTTHATKGNIVLDPTGTGSVLVGDSTSMGVVGLGVRKTSAAAGSGISSWYTASGGGSSVVQTAVDGLLYFTNTTAVSGTTSAAVAGRAYHTGTAAVQNLSGLLGEVDIGNAGGATNAAAITAKSSVNASSTISTLYGLNANIEVNNGNVVTSRLLSLSATNNGGTINTMYGLYIGSLAGDTRYAIVSNANAPSYLRGNLIIGNQAVGTSALTLDLRDNYANTALGFTNSGGGKQYVLQSTGTASSYGGGKLVVSDGGTARLAIDSANVGIGTATPEASLHVNGRVSFNGGTAPTILSCGSGPTVAGGSNDTRGRITTGSGTVTSCTIGFAQAFAAAPYCVATLNGASAGVPISVTTTTTDLTIYFGTSTPGRQWTYFCMQ